MARLVVGGGCFWCIEAAMKDLRGVQAARPGYAGGHVEHPTYEQVCAKRTGHAEVVEFEYDAEVIDHATLLRVFFTAHDPTQRNRQGNDVGPQYRSIVFVDGEAERASLERKPFTTTTSPTTPRTHTAALSSRRRSTRSGRNTPACLTVESAELEQTARHVFEALLPSVFSALLDG